MKLSYVNVKDRALKREYSKRLECFNFGDDNCYPSMIKEIINSSVTAKNAVDLNSKYIYGKGFQFVDGVDKSLLKINKKGETINQLYRKCSREFSEINNLYFHVNYNAEYKVIDVTILPSTDVRIGAKDSDDYNGKFILYNNWDRSKGHYIKKDDFKVIDTFNPNPKVIEAQVKAAGGWNKYKGQILGINSDFSSTYSLSDVDCVIYDAAAQHQASIFKHGGLQKGFLGSKIVVTKPFKNEEDKEDFVVAMENMQGAENTSGIFLLEANLDSSELDKEFLIQDITSNFDDKVFAHTEDSIRKNIRQAFGIPGILLGENDESAIFGQSGELLNNAKQTHWDSKEEERQIITEAFELIFSNFHKEINPSNNWDVVPIITPKEDNTGIEIPEPNE